ncbi:hypothetical protein HU200_020478 [Digitaria exilis]|uniref:RING-type domain-containing protein n=1 Tax=Digitaria exilis TaxID=1010633 RepID=A0A835F1V8_9POAL|nr:hypothetical protein HU200_020478 [Digitaria exilis]
MTSHFHAGKNWMRTPKLQPWPRQPTPCMTVPLLRRPRPAVSPAALADHFAAAHKWPCTTVSTDVRAGEMFWARLHNGFNFVVLADDGGDHQRLFLLNMIFLRYGHDGRLCSTRRHYQNSEFQYFQFLVLNSTTPPFSFLFLAVERRRAGQGQFIGVLSPSWQAGSSSLRRGMLGRERGRRRVIEPRANECECEAEILQSHSGGGGEFNLRRPPDDDANRRTRAQAEEADRRRSQEAVVRRLTVADTEALDCGVCFLPLKPPIFLQAPSSPRLCVVGHVLCSPCRDKLKGAGKCHVCRVSTRAGGYRRCHAMERMVDSLRAACPNAPYGCAAVPRPRGAHPDLPARAVPLPRRGVLASRAPRRRSGTTSRHQLRDGFNFAVSSKGHLLLLNVARHPFGRTVSQSKKLSDIWISYSASSSSSGSNERFDYYDQTTSFQIACYSDLSDGLPPEFRDGHQFILPNKYVHGLAMQAARAAAARRTSARAGKVYAGSRGSLLSPLYFYGYCGRPHLDCAIAITIKVGLRGVDARAKVMTLSTHPMTLPLLSPHK